MEYPSHVEKHFRETEELIRNVPSLDVASWLLEQGYFPELYVLPPSFEVSNFTLQNQPYNKDFNNLTKRKLISISHPKTLLTSRVFSIQHPYNYHDIVYHLEKEWEFILDHLFNYDNQVYSYSLPIPVTKKPKKKLSKLRSGRMIYEWLQMAEKDLILDCIHYQFIARTDITNFYSSVYTHSIAWALHGKEDARKDQSICEKLGTKIDKLYQYSNDGRTNGIPTGSVLSDLLAEIILAKLDTQISQNIKEQNIEFLAVIFKDDYRFLCQSEQEAQNILKIVSSQLAEFNLTVNENKTSILNMPDGLYRKHDREYFLYSLSEQEIISFKTFEYTLKDYLKSIIISEISKAFQKESTFEIVWLIFFSKYLGLGIQEEKQFKELVKEGKVTTNLFYKSIINSDQKIFKDTNIVLFKTPKKCRNRKKTLSQYLDVFSKETT
ncbi:RNA-directed DNA polymerase [Crocosphaera sp.]|uniref:RNA-directed DNA polymerase n=1 Tax=Crocosphaera sp. TaxID=2729996 RepID=UPI00262E8B61|nr:RNA-directed DNA polymerase [Crocosphaera sp.]MDJ0580451.1 RNA-directed DNA polymerase [Crocosphaera sp.]